MAGWLQNAIFTTLGALLALGGGVVIERLRQGMSRKNLSKAIRQLLLEELDFLEDALSRLIANRKSFGSFLITYLNEITAIRGGFDRNRDNVTVLLPENERKATLSFYHKLQMACLSALAVENGALQQPIALQMSQFITQQRNFLLNDFQALETQLPGLRAALQNWKP